VACLQGWHLAEQSARKASPAVAALQTVQVQQCYRMRLEERTLELVQPQEPVRSGCSERLWHFAERCLPKSARLTAYLSRLDHQPLPDRPTDYLGQRPCCLLVGSQEGLWMLQDEMLDETIEDTRRYC